MFLAQQNKSMKMGLCPNKESDFHEQNFSGDFAVGSRDTRKRPIHFFNTFIGFSLVIITIQIKFPPHLFLSGEQGYPSA